MPKLTVLDIKDMLKNRINAKNFPWYLSSHSTSSPCVTLCPAEALWLTEKEVLEDFLKDIEMAEEELK